MSRNHLLTGAMAGVLLTGAALFTAPAAHSATSCPPPATSVRSTTYRTYPKTVALTFDDGPSTFTPQILAILKAKGVHATFFVTGRAARRDPATIRAIAAAGHRLGNHTDTHPMNVAGSTPRARFDTMSASAQAAQIDAELASVWAAAKVRPCFFRAPGGNHWTSTTLKVSRGRGMTVTNWKSDTRDWTQPGYASKAAQASIVKLATTSVTAVSTHPIVLMHDGKESPEAERVVSSNRSNTVASLTRIIDYYKARGYVFTDPLGHRF